MWETIFASFLTSSILTAVIVFLSRTWISERIKGAIKHEYDEKLESHKAQLQASTQWEIEKLKAQLQIASSERTIRLTRIFDETVQVITVTYEKLIQLGEAVSRYIDMVGYESTPPQAERRVVVAQKLQDFISYFEPKRLFLPKHLVIELEAIAEEMFEITKKFREAVEEGGDARRISQGRDTGEDPWLESNRKLRALLARINALEDSFRETLGIAVQNGNSITNR